MRIAFIAAWGALGTLARYGLDGLIQSKSGAGFPYGILCVNLSGCFLLGFVGRFALNHVSVPPDWRIALTAGFFGAFTTFSTFSWDTVRMLEDGQWLQAGIYVATSVLLGLAVMFAGMRIGDAL